MSDTELKRVIETGVIESIGLPLGKTAKILAISEDIFLDMKSQIRELQSKLTAKEQSLAKANDQIERMREREKEQQKIIDAASQLICMRCLFTDGYDPEPEAVCCGYPVCDETGEYCCGHPEPEWKACIDCGGTRKPITPPTDKGER